MEDAVAFEPTIEQQFERMPDASERLTTSGYIDDKTAYLTLLTVIRFRSFAIARITNNRNKPSNRSAKAAFATTTYRVGFGLHQGFGSRRLKNVGIFS